MLAWGRIRASAATIGCAKWTRSTAPPASLPNLMDILRKHHVTHVVVHADRDRVNPELLARLKWVMGDEVVQLYEVPVEVEVEGRIKGRR